MRFLSTAVFLLGSILFFSSTPSFSQPPPPGSDSSLAFDADGYVVPNNISPLSIDILRFGDVAQPCAVTVVCQSPTPQELSVTRSSAAIVGVDYLCGGTMQTTTAAPSTTTTTTTTTTRPATTTIAGGPFPPPPPPPGSNNNPNTTPSPTTSAPTTTTLSPLFNPGFLLRWSAGDGGSKNISIPLFHSAINGTRKTFRVAMQVPQGCFLGDPSNALVYINYLPQVGPITTTPPPTTSSSTGLHMNSSTGVSELSSTAMEESSSSAMNHTDLSSTASNPPSSSTGSNNDRTECYKDSLARDYRGTIAVTKSGKQCQAWSSQSPHTHTITSQNYPNADLVENYCRNPSGDGSAWCFTTDQNTIREDCSIGEPWSHCVIVAAAESSSGLSREATIGLAAGLGGGGGLLLIAAGIGYWMKKKNQNNNENNNDEEREERAGRRGGGGGDVLNRRHHDDKNLPAIHELKAIDAVNLVPKTANEEKEPPASVDHDNNNNNNMLYDDHHNHHNNNNNNNNHYDDDEKKSRPSKTRSRSNRNKRPSSDPDIDLESGELKLNIIE